MLFLLDVYLDNPQRILGFFIVVQNLVGIHRLNPII